ncbi:hypothetical protein OIU76_030171 [Salix suchowensis]|nr:hypothetical protein OIU76_030171 [Salix suchowensis]
MKKRNRYSSSSCVWKHLNPDANWNGEVIKGEFLPLPSQVRQIDFIVSDCKSCPGTSYDDTFRARQVSIGRVQFMHSLLEEIWDLFFSGYSSFA